MSRDLTDFDLGAAMRSLYETGAYFTPLAPGEDASFEEHYWGTVIDPDGNQRKRLEERQLHLDNIKAELAFIETLPAGRIVDIGCGLGWLLSGIAPDWERHGVEVSDFAADHADAHGAIHRGTLDSAIYPDHFFDLVVMHHVIEHMIDPVANIERVQKMLRTGGWLVLGTPDFDSGCARRFGANYRLLHDPTHISLFSNDSMHRFLRDHGFEIHNVDYPFFETLYFSEENLLRLFDMEAVSPPFYGNFMTFYCRKV